MSKTLNELKIGTYDNIETASEHTSIILALKKFVERRVSAFPIIDPEGRLVDIYAKFDVIVSIYNACSAFMKQKLTLKVQVFQMEGEKEIGVNIYLK
jgi:CBS-domain-containing membrane protein